MTLTLLLDLDDTLLDTNIEQFVPAYFQALSNHLESRVQPNAMLAALASGTRRMLANQHPAHTLQEIFDAEFFPQLGISREALQPEIDRFYDEIFPSLGALMRPRPDAAPLVEWAFAQGFCVVVATDPLFPLKAIHHRLRFAGLPPEQFPFALVSSYETFHFTKSHPAYFAEVLGRLGGGEGPALMVGNDADRDLGPARALGLPTFWVNGDPPQGSDPEADGRGGLSDLRPWLESADPRSLEPKFETTESFLALLTAAPASIASLVQEMDASRWASRPAPAEWALTEVLCHLRDTELEVNQPRLKRLLDEDEPFIPVRDTKAWADDRNYLAQDGRVALREFLSARVQLLDRLRQLTSAEWGRKARHAIFGPTTLQEMTGFMAKHDRLHIQQIWKLIHPGE